MQWRSDPSEQLRRAMMDVKPGYLKPLLAIEKTNLPEITMVDTWNPDVLVYLIYPPPSRTVHHPVTIALRGPLGPSYYKPPTRGRIRLVNKSMKDVISPTA